MRCRGFNPLIADLYATHIHRRRSFDVGCRDACESSAMAGHSAEEHWWPMANSYPPTDEALRRQIRFRYAVRVILHLLSTASPPYLPVESRQHRRAPERAVARGPHVSRAGLVLQSDARHQAPCVAPEPPAGAAHGVFWILFLGSCMLASPVVVRLSPHVRKLCHEHLPRSCARRRRTRGARSHRLCHCCPSRGLPVSRARIQSNPKPAEILAKPRPRRPRTEPTYSSRPTPMPPVAAQSTGLVLCHVRERPHRPSNQKNPKLAGILAKPHPQRARAPQAAVRALTT
jgi:hypothetical protein